MSKPPTYKVWQVGLAVVAAVGLGVLYLVLGPNPRGSKKQTSQEDPRDAVQREVKLENEVRDAAWDGDVLLVSVHRGDDANWNGYAEHLCNTVRAKVKTGASVRVRDKVSSEVLGQATCN